MDDMSESRPDVVEWKQPMKDDEPQPKNYWPTSGQ